MQHLQNTQGVEAAIILEYRGRELSKLSLISSRNNQTYHKKGESSVTPRLMERNAKKKEECRKAGYKNVVLVSSSEPLNQKQRHLHLHTRSHRAVCLLCQCSALLAWFSVFYLYLIPKGTLNIK